MLYTTDIHEEAVREAFLEALEESTGNVNAALRAVNVSKTMAYRAKKAYPEFAAAWDETVTKARMNRLPYLEQTALERATVGTIVPVYNRKWKAEDFEKEPAITPADKMARAYGGKNVVGYKVIPPSDKLLEILLRAEDPKRYGPPKVDIKVDAAQSYEELIGLIVEDAKKEGILLDHAEARRNLIEFVAARQAQETKEPVN